MKILKMFAYLFLGLSFNSCMDFLDLEPLDEISNSSFWNTENDMKYYNNQIYDLASDCEKSGIMIAHGNAGKLASYWHFDYMSDNMATTRSSFSFYIDIRTGVRVVPTKVEQFDYQGWELLRTINFGLENYNRVNVDASIRNKYIAEAKLFRGWFYGVKVERYGDVQWTNKALDVNSAELYGKRTPRAEVMDSVLADLNFATTYLPNDWEDGSSPGRMNRWCALLIKSRICLFEGTFRKYHGLPDYERWLIEAKKSSNELIEDGPYSLYQTSNPIENEDYAFIHRQKDLTGNPQVLYWRRYKKGVLTHNAFNWFSSEGGGATRDMVESYLMSDGKPMAISSYSYNDETMENVFENRDPRLRQSILHPEDKTKRKFYGDDKLTYPRLLGMVGGKVINTGYHVIKQYSYDLYEPTANQSEQAGIILQYAEALLNYAEAVAELNEITQDDIDKTINKLRDRVNMPHLDINNVPIDPQAAIDGVTPLIFEIRRERRVELFCEGFRYDDLMRWKLGRNLAKKAYGIRWDDKAKERFPDAKQVKSSIDPLNNVEYVDVFKGTQWENARFNEERDYLWPIPLNIITENTEIVQNPNW